MRYRDLPLELRKSLSHCGDPCLFCNVAHDDVESGPCPKKVERLYTRANAAAPDLLEACEAAVAFYGDNCFGPCVHDKCIDVRCSTRDTCWLWKAKAAIAKAEGKEKGRNDEMRSV